MISRQKFKGSLAGILLTSMFLSISGTANAVDDGARAYWKARHGSHVVSTQYLSLDMQATDTQMFDPSHFIFPNADAEADLFIASYAYHFTLFGKRPSTLSFNLLGGTADVDISTTADLPAGFLPPGAGASLRQSASGFGDPTVQLDVNLFGTPPLYSSVDLLNYEPTWTVDAAVMLGLPVGNYDGDRLVNIGQNRFFSRFALPMKYHFGRFAPGYMASFELTPSVWVFGENDNFLGQTMENDPLWQVESHLTYDFTRSFNGSLDFLYRRGFQSEIDGVSMGGELEVGDVGLTLNYQVTDGFAVRSSFSSNVFGDEGLDSSAFRIQFVYGWNKATENLNKLLKGKH